ncbi:MAG: 3-oxoacyl-[acyl-carrier-protein] reductase [Bdellovibrionaceae bacterium]|nr:3-oxoacyl-[acyl-carrier-protein] reductase [Pseudobdellovibrionaceae bacterium]
MLTGKKILVTGGSRGIGAEIVKSLAEAGAQVAFTYSSNQASAQKILESLPGDGHRILAMNVADENSVNTALETLIADWKEFDGLVNNAGITKDGLLMRMKSEDFDSVINTNLKGTFYLTKAITKIMMKSRKGSVVQITSVIGQTGNAGQANYAASKAAVVAFSKSIALELGSRGVRVNCVAPGFIETDMTEVLSDDVKQKIMDKIPLQRMGASKDVAEAVKFLLSDQSSYITGHTLSVNGGLFME